MSSAELVVKIWGPRTEPWGTPEVTGEGWDVGGWSWMNSVWFERQETSLSGGAVSNANGSYSVVEDGVRITV